VFGYAISEAVGQEENRLLWLTSLENGRIRGWSKYLFFDGRPSSVLKKDGEGQYDELTYLEDGGHKRRVYKKGFLAEYMREDKQSSLRGQYHRGKLGFWFEQTMQDAKKGILKVYDENDELLDTVNLAFGEYYETKFEDRDGKPVKIFRKTRGKKIVNEVIRSME
jgi:hypothetical protein